MNLPDFSDSTPKAVALDLDETTLNSSSRIDDRTRSALHATHDAGLPIIIATSRPERVLPILVGDDILAITSLVQMNGTIAEGKAGLSGSLKYPMDLEDARICWNTTTEQTPWARMTLEIDGTQFAVNHDDDINELWAFNMATPTMVVSFDEAMAMEPVKVSINGMDQSLESLATTLEQKLSNDMVILRAASERFLNIVPKRASKSGAVADLLKTAGIGLPDVLSFGDDYVDIDLIRDCGWSVAVDNAIPEIKSLAKFQTASNDDFGVAIVLERLVAALR
ncbi:HAD family phosphatase [Dehalococcoides mccartyi]|nr:HAD family phosphatase [Dehalococcoides mccartyi]